MTKKNREKALLRILAGIHRFILDNSLIYI
jgi:hypothetical protein